LYRKKNEDTKVVEKLETWKFGSVCFWYIIHPKKLQNMQEMAQRGPTLEIFTETNLPKKAIGNLQEKVQS
jgi:hypothetical protein